MSRFSFAAVLAVCLASPISAQPEGFPPLDATEIYREMDLQTLVRAYSDMHPEVGFLSVYNAYLKEGSTQQNVGIMETSVDSRQIVLTANSETIYAVHPVNLSEQGGAVVVEVPQGMQGMANVPGWWNITDIGGLGPDRGQGGRYLFTAPDYVGEIPDGYYHFESPANTILWLLRGFVEDGDTEAAVANMQAGIRTYSLSDAANPPETTFYNTSESMTNGHPMDMLYEKEDVLPMVRQYFELNGPNANPMREGLYSLLYDAGFFDGTVDPTLMNEAAAIGDINQRTRTFNNRAPNSFKWPDESSWQWANNYADENFTDRANGVYSSSQHQVWSHMATFNSVGMTRPPRGTGSQYIYSSKDSEGQWLDGGNHYTLTIPAEPPADDFWSIILYDAEYRSMLKNESFRWGVNSYAEDLEFEDDGSAVLHFAPEQPDGVAMRNWVETNPGEGYMIWFRTYGPTDAWYDDSWILPDISKQ